MPNAENLKPIDSERARELQKLSAKKRKENKIKYNVMARALEIMAEEDASLAASIRKTIDKGGANLNKLMEIVHKSIEGEKITGDITVRKRLFDD